MYRPTKSWRQINSAAAKATPHTIAVQAATQADLLAPARSFAPTLNPTRMVAAMPSASGTMNVTPTMLNAIWCAATVSTPRRPIKQRCRGEERDLHEQRQADRDSQSQQTSDLGRFRPRERGENARCPRP